MYRLKQVLSAEELTAAREILNEAYWNDGQHTAGWQARGVKNNQQAEAAIADALADGFLQALERHTDFHFAARPKKVLPPLFSRYTAGMGYGSHVDEPLMQGTRCDLSLTLFLSDPASYEGGELIIETPYGIEAVKLAAGDAILYPSTMIHRVNEVTSGTRLAAVTWIRSVIREFDQREILLDLEVARREIMHKHGKSPELDLIAKVSANLMRRWADD